VPRPRLSNDCVAIRKLQGQASSVLAKLRKDIRAKEIELARLKRDEESLGRLAGRGRAFDGGERVPRAAAAEWGSGEINWRNVLAQLPKQFKAPMSARCAAKDKRPSEIFAAITRWIDAGSQAQDSWLYEG